MCEKEFENTASFAFRVNNSIIGALSRLSSYLIVCSHFHLWFLMKIEIWETCHLLEVNPPQLARMYKTEAAVAVHCSNYGKMCIFDLNVHFQDFKKYFMCDFVS